MNAHYEYDVAVIHDTCYGSTNINQLKTVLMKYSLEGWRLVHIFTNELGKSASSLTVGSITSGSNSTVDQTILIFERMIKETGEIK